jgi:DNA-binding CsgD family transcriptional regulator
LSTPEPGLAGELSEREREILRRVATGVTNKEIGQQLHITENTVKVHLRNIYAKIGAASRTEAALWAVRNGLVAVPGAQGDDGTSHVAAGPDFVPAADWPALPQPPLGPPARADVWGRRAVLLIPALAALIVGLGLLANVLRPSPAAPISPTAPPRWQAKADLPTARSGLAVAAYENKVYAVGGEALEGVTDRVERYDPATDTWETLRPKPLPVAHVSAAVVGGKIYVPGGRLASGGVTDVLEAYDPRQDRWEQRAPMPAALSAYALVAFEGRLYLFGGWDGKRYRAEVYEYDPSRDVWAARAPMPTARGFAGAAVAGGRIYVIGGTAGGAALAVNEEYVPEKDADGAAPWTQRAPMPEARYAMGIAAVADIVLIIGGEGEADKALPYEYFPQRDAWQAFEFPVTDSWRGPGVGVVETNLHTLGGVRAGAPATGHLVYQAIYAVFIPIVP